jgi:hypothetical protein
MQRIVALPWSPVLSAKVRPPKRQAVSLGALAAMERLRERERELAKSNRLRALGGCLTLAFTFATGFLLLSWMLRLSLPVRIEATPEPPNLLGGSLAIEAILLVLAIPIAIAVRPRSRSDVVNKFLETGGHSGDTRDNPLLRWALTIIMLGFLYGEFLIVDSVKSAFLRLRLRNVDRHRGAIILHALLTEPRGIDPRLLLQLGENPLHLRHTLAYLIAHEWADISPHGDWLTLVSQSRRQLRRAQNDFLAPSTD